MLSFARVTLNFTASIFQYFSDPIPKLTQITHTTHVKGMFCYWTVRLNQSAWNNSMDGPNISRSHKETAKQRKKIRDELMTQSCDMQNEKIEFSDGNLSKNNRDYSRLNRIQHINAHTFSNTHRYSLRSWEFGTFHRDFSLWKFFFFVLFNGQF